jgi:hypothetical protein
MKIRLLAYGQIICAVLRCDSIGKGFADVGAVEIVLQFGDRR